MNVQAQTDPADKSALQQLSDRFLGWQVLASADVFCGRPSNVNDFLSDFDRAMKNLGVTRLAPKLFHLVNCLRGDAKLWFWTLARPLQSDYRLLRRALVEEFSVSSYELSTLRSNIYQCQQLSGEKLSHYVMRVRAKSASLHLDEQELVNICIRGASY